MNQHASVSLSDPDTQRCPFAHYREWQKEQPVYVDPKTGIYVITRYESVRSATMNTRALSSQAGLISVRQSTVMDQVRALYDAHGWMPIPTLVNNDPPTHTRFRSLVDRAFVTTRVKQLEPMIVEAIDQLIDGFIDDGEVEFVSRFAMMLPLLVFCEELGIPKSEASRIKHWSDVLLEQMDPLLEPERELQLTREVIELENYIAAKAEQYLREPSDCMLSKLVHATNEQGERLSMQELVSVVMQLIPAGHETTANAIATGMRVLVEQPELAASLRKEPELVAGFVEETLRIDAPIQGLWRKAVEPIEVDGVTIPAGATVFLCWGAANRDPEKFEAPDRFDPRRANARQHLSFGMGAHFCVGNQLSRAELRLSFERIVARMTDFRYAEGEALRFRAHSFAFGPELLRMRFTKRV